MDNEPLYLDTNVFMDFFLGRDQSAFELLHRAMACEFRIIVSDMIVKELRRQGLERETRNLFALLKGLRKLCMENVQGSDHDEADKAEKDGLTHYADAVHKAVAKRSGARFLVTKNVRDFTCFTDIDVRRPDEL